MVRLRLPGVSIRVGTPAGTNEIQGVDTSTAAFVGAAAAGAPTEPVLVTSFSDYVQEFGGSDGELGRAVRLFFENGGSRTYVLRSQGDLAEGLGKLESVAFALLAIPDVASLDPDDAATVADAAIELSERRRAFAVLDPPLALAPGDIPNWASALGPARNAAVYVPRLQLADGSETAASGAVAGIYARTDRERGVWRAPAGSGTRVQGAVDVTVTLSEDDVRALNPAGVNVVRRVPGRLVVWGARTLASDHAQRRYVNVRRFALFLERSIDAGTQWAVFEPNGEQLWREVRRRVEAFMLTLFQQGAFAATTPDDAYFVRCDRMTMTQEDIDNGRLVVVVGFAPHRPAEFVVLRIE